MVNMNMIFYEKTDEFVEKFKEYVALAAEALKKIHDSIKKYTAESNNWRKIHGMPMRRWRHLNNAAYNRRKRL